MLQCRLTFGYEVNKGIYCGWRVSARGARVAESLKHWYLESDWSRGIEHSKVG